MIPNYYDQKDAHNLQACDAVESGRTITKDGKPFVYISRCTDSKENACVADYFTYVIVDLLNRSITKEGNDEQTES